jgi:hypothetical protein
VRSAVEWAQVWALPADGVSSVRSRRGWGSIGGRSGAWSKRMSSRAMRRERSPDRPSCRWSGWSQGSSRRLVAEERVDRLLEHWPERCFGRGRFGEDERTITAPPHRHQVAELPELAVEIEEHRAQRLRCSRCGGNRRAVLPAAVAASAFGPPSRPGGRVRAPVSGSLACRLRTRGTAQCWRSEQRQHRSTALISPGAPSTTISIGAPSRGRSGSRRIRASRPVSRARRPSGRRQNQRRVLTTGSCGPPDGSWPIRGRVSKAGRKVVHPRRFAENRERLHTQGEGTRRGPQ